MDFKVKNRHRLKNKDIRNIQAEIQQCFKNIFLEETCVVESGEINGSKIIFVDDLPCLQIVENRTVITLHGINKFKPRTNFVVVDMGAVKFVTSGADVMAPGIVDADTSIEPEDQVWVCDERYHKPLAAGLAIMDGEQMKYEKKGKAVKTLSYVGDWLWDFPAKSL